MSDLTESQIRKLFREEIQRAIPTLNSRPALLTIRECAKKYRLGYDKVRVQAENGQLKTLRREEGKNGLPQLLIDAADAEAKLGGGM